MIKRVELVNFKKFSDTKIELKANDLSIVVGGNNAGKSSLLQALAIWNYAKSVTLFSRPKDALCLESKRDGVGINIDDFHPLNLPSFEYLWTNLKANGGYTLKIKVVWDDKNDVEKYLEMGFSLTLSTLYVRKNDSNLNLEDEIPEIAYLPPFAGITEKESWLSIADRRKQIGKGLAGSILRNLIYDYYLEHQEEERHGFMAGDEIPKKKREKKTGKKMLEDSLSHTNFRQINLILAQVFNTQLFPEFFSLEFHNYIKMPLKKGEWTNGEFNLHKDFSARDIMAEGRGFLQWLSTLCLLFDSKVDVLLLDEPDAHLHATLQIELINHLISFISKQKKQILIATHSSEVIKSVPPSSVLEVKSKGTSYCTTDSQIRAILNLLGVEHFPLLYKVQQIKKIVFVEAPFDERILKKFAKKLNKPIENKVVFWCIANNHSERKQIYLHLKNEIKGLNILSLEDKDGTDYGNTTKSLFDKSSNNINEKDSSFSPLRWRRWEMESYLIHPKAIAEASKQTAPQIEQDILDEFSIKWAKDYKASDRSNSNAPLFDRDGKTIIEFFQKKYKFSKEDLPDYFEPDEIPEDIITMIDKIHSL